ncbi:hypothetical protein [Roseicella sp. DB1501]
MPAKADSCAAITNLVILDHWRIVKADIGIKGRPIAAIRDPV